MPIALKFEQLCSVLWNDHRIGSGRIEAMQEFIEVTYNSKIDVLSMPELENFLKSFDKKMISVRGDKKRFKLKYCTWMDTTIEIFTYSPSSGAPCKSYDSLCWKSKKQRISEKLSSISKEEVSDTFKEMLKKENQPSEAIEIADILPLASPNRLKRIIKSVPTPTSQTSFTEEEAIALMLELGISRNKYMILRKALLNKGHSILPSYKAIQEKKQ